MRAGVFLGEEAAFLKVVGDAFIQLLQMSALPYTVAVAHPDVLALPVAYGMARSDREWTEFVNPWIDLKKKDRTIASLYDYWVLGESAADKEPRWSVIRNVLHWVI
jgi:hypothetical protein